MSDTSPLNYLVQVGQASLPAALFGTLLITKAVETELSRPQAPAAVRSWIASKPPWLIVDATATSSGAPLQHLHYGERETLQLALTTGADLILMDDRAGVAAARARGLRVTGTLGVLDLAGERKLIDVSAVLSRLRATNFPARPHMISALLASHGSVGHG